MTTLIVRRGVWLAACVLGVGANGLEATQTSLAEAVKAGDRAAVRALLKSPGGANVAEIDGTTPLHWAVRADDVETVRLLLGAGAHPRAANRYGVTPLALAAINGNGVMIQALLNAGADASEALHEGVTVLMLAARTGAEDAVNLLLARGANPNAAERWQGETALMWAAAEDHAAAARALIVHRADFNARSARSAFPTLDFGGAGLVPMALPKGGFTPLMFAARQGALAAARVLAEAGADLNATEPDGTSALVLAIINAHYDVAALLVERGADPNVADASGMAALYAAVDMNMLGWMQGRPAPKGTSHVSSLDLIQQLLARGADPNAQLKSPLLLRHHAMGDPVLGEGATPFARTAKTGDLAAMRALLEHGADPGLIQKNGTTPLMVAAGLGWRDGGGALPVYDKGSEADAIAFIRLCLDRGANVNAANANGDTALHGAAVRGADPIVRFLVEQGARLDGKNKQGRTPLDVALRRADRAPSTVALLRQLAAATRVNETPPRQ